MGANYSHTTRASGLTLTPEIYNGDHQNHIDNGIPQKFDDYSSNASQMRLTTDPGEEGSESLATSLAGEIERLRFAIKEIKENLKGASIAQWFTSLAQGLTETHTATNGTINLPNGIVLQWGYTVAVTTTASIGNFQTIDFAYNSAFPNQVLASFGTPASTDLGSSGEEDVEHTFSIGSLGVASGRARILRVSGANTGSEAFGFRWLVIGR